MDGYIVCEQAVSGFAYWHDANTAKGKKMKRISLVMMIVIGLCALHGLSIQLEVDPMAWQSRSGSSVQPLIMEPGNPSLPFYPVQILVPFGETVETVEVTLSNLIPVRSGVELDYVRHQQPTSMPAPDMTIRNPEVWNLDAMYPGRDYDYLGTQRFRGYELAIVNVYPWRYNPISKQIYAAQNVTINIHSSFDSDRAGLQANFVTHSYATRRMLESFVANPQAISSYAGARSFRSHQSSSRLIDLSNPKRMIIITDSVRSPWFDEYVLWRTAQGVSCSVFLTDDIYNEYGGANNAEKVRNFIIDVYQSWADTATPLEYVILGGDDEIIPERGAFGRVGQTVDNRMPTDIYYSNLDGNWNANGNSIYGEVNDEVDMIPEVHIGRFPAEAQIEFENIFRKTRHYVENSSFANNVALMIGENLNWNPLTWGGDYKDDVALHIPDTYSIQTLYQRDGNYNGSLVWHAINNGANVMNHMGHANETSLMGQAINTVNSLQNDQYGFLYTQGCYPAAFDQRTSGDGESIGEHFVIASSALFAFIGNTRYGWYMPGSINGASQYYDREYFIGMFEHAYEELGAALTYSRLANLNAALSSDVMRWCYYEVVLFGDPSIQVKYPDAMMPLLSLNSYSIDDSEGDDDGTLNPGEIIRIYPRIANHADWHTAYNISLNLENLPEGSVLLSDPILIDQLAAGAISSDQLYFRVQLGEELSFGNYTISLVMDAAHPITNASVGIRRYVMDFSVTLLDNRFPWEFEVATKSSPVVHDFDNDGSLDILYMDVFGGVHIIGSDGEEFITYDTTDALNINSSFAMADLNGNGTMDIVVASRTGIVTAIQTDGTPIFSLQTDTQHINSPIIGDIDGSGNPDIIVSGLDRKIYAFDHLGNLKSGFPVQLSGSIPSEMAVANIDGEPGMEIIAGSGNGMLYVIKGDGSNMDGWPVQLEGSVTGAPTVLDNGRISCGTSSFIYLLEADGSIVFQRPINANIAGGIVLSDMSGNNQLELIAVTSTGMLYVLDQSGNDRPGFPVNIGEYFTCPPIIADLDGDNYYDIVLQSYMNSVFIIRNNGQEMPGFPFPTAFNGATPATLVDFDDDGYFKLVAGFSHGILMVNLRKQSNGRTPWTVYRGSLSRQGSYASTGFVSNDDLIQAPLAMNLHQNYPNPFNPQTTIKYDIPAKSFVQLSIYNLKGQLVKNLVRENKEAGRHSLIWNGKDESGRSVGSGIYYYRLETKGNTQTRKMLLIK